ncbi:hypothetical protein F5Y19DRAFT_472788 [Xylariaceae sp. FL1651]|nr:hypothetical protein F5Y19DRAFT_472788 [Xylariaceae sp. FL1651]
MVFGSVAPVPLVSAAPGNAAVKVDHTCEYRIHELSTRSVTLFPSRAHIVRDIKNISLKTGNNQVTILGLTPTLDEHSVKVEGTGSAIITDLVVELVPNRDIFDDVYPDISDSNDESDSDLFEQDNDDENPELKAVEDKICQLSDDEKAALEAVRSAESRLKLLDIYGQSIVTDASTDALEDGIETYRVEREKVFRDHQAGEIKEREIRKKLVALQKVKDRLLSRAARDRAKVRTSRDKEREKRRRKELGQAKEGKRLRRERESYWPKKVYTVKVSLEVVNLTPSTSRRSSVIDDLVKAASDDEERDTYDNSVISTCDLTLSYVTSNAFWSPTYDLALSTTANTGVLCFDARLTNHTSETWDKCKIVLSTSQTEFSGFGDVIPSLVPWRIFLANEKMSSGLSDIAYSPEEIARQSDLAKQRFNTRFLQRPRHEIFGVERTSSLFSRPPQNSLFGQPSQAPPNQIVSSSALGPTGQASQGFRAHGEAPTQASKATSAALFGNSLFQASKPVSTGGLFGTINPVSKPSFDYEECAQVPDVQATLPASQPDLEFEESTFEEVGLTATYDLPGLKSLSPSSTASRQRVVRITYSNVTFNHIVVAKYKRAAFLKAKVQNSSKLTLLKGQTGLTLDGSFLGRITLPRCSPGDSFTLNLGVDPSVEVIYPKPEVKRSSSSMFSLSKENSALYTRTLTLVNTRTEAQGKAVRVSVLDQIPVSEDERLRIELLKPHGLVLDGPSARTGEPTQKSRVEEAWGKAEAQLKKGGEIAWDVMVNPGCSAKLGLEYLCVFPAGEQAVNV